MAKRKRYRTDAIDRLSARISQARAAVLALRFTFGEKVGADSRLSNEMMVDFLWGISDQLDDANQAFHKMLDDMEAERLKNEPTPQKPLTRAEHIQRMRETCVITNDRPPPHGDGVAS